MPYPAISKEVLSLRTTDKPEDTFLHPEAQNSSSTIVFGSHKTIIQIGIWLNVLWMALYHYKNPFTAFKSFKSLKKLRTSLRGNYPVIKYAKVDGKYYFSFNAPGWPSKAFNRYISNNIKKLDSDSNEVTLDNLLFGITKKCGYKCEHCFEWEVLNQKETLSREDLIKIIHSFQEIGITQVQLSGGEPLNRFNDILYILKTIRKGTEVWLYTSGYHFTKERALRLKLEGLTGIIVSLDHYIPEVHNKFRGNKNAFEWAEKAVMNAREQNLVTCLSLCATKEFITKLNLNAYAEMARQLGISFIQVLEPRAVGHYSGKDVFLDEEHITVLENFYTEYNYNKLYQSFPLIVYHGFYSRRVGCGGSGRHYVYADTDGDVHNCPFCQRKIFSALSDNVKENIRNMAMSGCNTFIKSPH